MKNLILIIFILCSFRLSAQTSAAIFDSGDVRLLEPSLIFQDSDVKIITNDTDDPSAVSKDAVKGSQYIQSGTGKLFSKQDAGSSTNWFSLDKTLNSCYYSGFVLTDNGGVSFSWGSGKIYDSNDETLKSFGSGSGTLDVSCTNYLIGTGTGASRGMEFRCSPPAYASDEIPVAKIVTNTNDITSILNTPKCKEKYSDFKTQIDAKLSGGPFSGASVVFTDNTGIMQTGGLQYYNDIYYYNSDLFSFTGSANIFAYDSSSEFLLGPLMPLRLMDEGFLGYKVGLLAPSELTTSYDIHLPIADGTTNQVLKTNGSGQWGWTTISGTGEINTASNVGSGGQGLFKQKTVYDLEFKNINAGAGITVTNDAANNEIDIASTITQYTDALAKAATISDVAYDSTTWNGVLDIAPSKNSVRDQNEVLVTSIATKEPSITATTSADYYRGDKTFQTLNKAAVGLSNVDNTTDAGKPVSTAQQTALDLKANLADPTFTGTVSGITKAMVGLGSVVNSDTTTTANITDSSNKRFVTDANLTTIGNQSGTNTGDQTSVSGNAGTVTNGVYTTDKDATGGVPGLTLFKINFKNAANTFTNFLTNATTAARTYTFPDKDITVAGLVDITGTNSGTNTGDQTITLTGGVTGAGTGSFATTVVTNANLTGDVTSSGNATTIGSNKITRDMLNSTAVTGGKNWVYLGQATASGAVRTGTLTWAGTFKQLRVEYFIPATTGTMIARIITGPTAGPSETATTFCASIIEGVTLNTTSVSVPGYVTSVTVSTAARYGIMEMSNQASVVKRMTGYGNLGGTAPTTVPTQERFNGLYNNTSTLVNSISMVSYATLTATTVHTSTFNSGTYVNVWGRNDD